MAVLKHIASKNADYSEIQRYLIFQHDEYTGKPILDESGRMIPRKEYYVDGINCDPFSFDVECRELNAKYHKNQDYDDVKSHHYIISFDPKDAEEKASVVCMNCSSYSFASLFVLNPLLHFCFCLPVQSL